MYRRGCIDTAIKPYSAIHQIRCITTPECLHGGTQTQHMCVTRCNITRSSHAMHAHGTLDGTVGALLGDTMGDTRQLSSFSLALLLATRDDRLVLRCCAPVFRIRGVDSVLVTPHSRVLSGISGETYVLWSYIVYRIASETRVGDRDENGIGLRSGYKTRIETRSDGLRRPVHGHADRPSNVNLCTDSTRAAGPL